MAFIRVKIDKEMAQSFQDWVFQAVHSKLPMRPPCRVFATTIGCVADFEKLATGMVKTLSSFLGQTGVQLARGDDFIKRVFFSINQNYQLMVDQNRGNFPVYLYSCVEQRGDTRVFKIFINASEEGFDIEDGHVVAERDGIDDDLEVVMLHYRPTDAVTTVHKRID